MEAKEHFIEDIKSSLLSIADITAVNLIIDSIVLNLEDYDLVPKERGIVKYDDEDAITMKRFFVAKAVEGLSPRTV